MTSSNAKRSSSSSNLTAEQLKDAGNKAYQNGDLQEALDNYTAALQIHPDDELKATIYRNRALVRLKLEDYEGCESDATNGTLIFTYANLLCYLALYRRASAREMLENYAGAILDLRDFVHVKPNDQNVNSMLRRVSELHKKKMDNVNSLDNRVKTMNDVAFIDGDLERRKKAMNNLLVLSRDSETGASRVWSGGKALDALLNIMRDSNADEELVVAAIRVLDELMKKSERAMFVVKKLGMPQITRLLCLRNTATFVDACSVVIQRVFNAIAKMDRQKEVKPDPEVCEANKMEIIRILLELEQLLTDVSVTSIVRETIIDLLTKNLMHMDGGLPRGWSWRFVEDRGLLKLLDVSTQIVEQYDYPVSAETRQHLAICLQRLDSDMVFDNRRAIFKDRLDRFFNQLLERANEPQVKIKIAALLITLLQGPVDLGINLVTNEQITAMMLQMAGSDDKLQQSVAAELIVQTVSKHERATTILKLGVPILRKLYESDDENVKVRALMGLCKCAAAGGDDSSRQTMQEGSTLKLAKTCKKFLLDINVYSVEVRSFACEGLSYLSLDADVKEWIVEDPLLLQALLSLAKSAGALCSYTLASIYVNCSNAYEKPKIDEELVKLAQFAKHHVPETHPKDTDDFVEKRIRALVKDGATAACVAISKTESKNTLELLARALLAFSEFPDLRGQVISEGGCKLLLRLTKEATGEGKIKAAHAIARLGVQADPTIAFPGQRAYEVVKPLTELLHPDIEGRPNYDALMTLTNLASVSDSVRKRMLKERIVPKAEEYWFMVEHPHLRAAAAELFLNLLFCDEYFQMVAQPGTDRLKLWFLYTVEEDERLAMASTAGFAILTEDPKVCQRIVDEFKSWPEVLGEICFREHPEVQRRGLLGIKNMILSSEKVASEIISSEVFRRLQAVAKLNNTSHEASKKVAQESLEAAEKWGLIQPTERELYERRTGMSTVTEE
uniref:Protein unc-45 homolog B n=1 Tax=Syphacia muris TaxID=451379 RepID=A0A0N5AQ81_9BILA